jgi:hypothetical protein
VNLSTMTPLEAINFLNLLQDLIALEDGEAK